MKTVYYPAGRRVKVAGSRVAPKKTSALSEDVWDAFRQNEQEALSTHSNARVQAFLRTLQIKREIPLDKLQTALNALEAAGIIGVGRAAAIYDAVD